VNAIADRLYALLPAVYRVRDAEFPDRPLRTLIDVIAHELAAIEENLDQLYDDQFIETCAEWVAPYVGDLVGYRPLHGVVPGIAAPRADVANTIRNRRRKGTALMLEQLATDVTGWPAHAVECFERLATTQSMRHVRLHAPATADLRDNAALFAHGSAFDPLAHTVDVRSPARGGRYNIPNVAMFVWRLLAMRLTAVPLTADAGDASGRRFRMNPLGADMALFRSAVTEDDIAHLAEPINVPAPLSVRQLAMALGEDYDGRSVCLLRPGTPPTPVPIAEVRVCDLRDLLDTGGNVIGWNHEDDVPSGIVGFDPERGRVLLGSSADGPLLATFHHGSAREIGGGEYERVPSGNDATTQQVCSGGSGLQLGLEQVRGGGRLSIEDSVAYPETPTFKVDGVTAAGASGNEVVVSARNGARPVVLATGDMALAIGARGTLVLEGLVIAGGALRLAATGDDEPRTLILRDCTLVPGLALKPNGSATSPGQPSLVIAHPFAKVTIERCITGPLQVDTHAEIELRDTIVDAGAPHAVAFDGDGSGGAGGELTIKSCTLIGKVHTRLMSLASNSLFFANLAATDPWAGPVIADRRQSGCMRFCFVPRRSITPRRHRCVPDAAHPTVLPHFTSLRYGTPGYIQLRAITDPAIRQGADDEGEMGVLHPLYQPQREANLRIRVEEYLRFGLRAGLFHST
jgi:hypothetical protein